MEGNRGIGKEDRLDRAGRGASPVSTDAVRDYLQRIGRIPLLSAEQEVEVARRIEVGVLATARLAGPGPLDEATQSDLLRLIRDGRHAYDLFIRSNLRLVVSIAKRYAGRGLPLMDVIQEGNLGLVRAVEKFDYTTGNKFSTYATWWIRQAILRGIADCGRLIRIPVHTAEKVDKIKRMRRELSTDLGRPPTARELASATGLAPAELLKLEGTDHETVSLAVPVGSDGSAQLGDVIEDTDNPGPLEAIISTLRTEDIHRRLRTIPLRDATVVRLRFGLDGRHPLTLEEVGELYGITRERVRQLETRSLKRLRSPDLQEYLV